MKPSSPENFLNNLASEKVLDAFYKRDGYQIKEIFSGFRSLTASERKDLTEHPHFSFRDVVSGLLSFEDEVEAREILGEFLDSLPNWQNDFYSGTWSPLHETARTGKLHLFDTLLEKGASPSDDLESFIGKKKTSLLETAVECYMHPRFQDEVMEAVLSVHSFGQSQLDAALFKAVNWNNLGAVKALIAHGANPYQLKVKDGFSALYLACVKDPTKKADDIVKVLLSAKETENVINDNWDKPCKSPVHVAANKGRLNVLKMLFEKGALLDHPEKKDGVTPLMQAAKNSDGDTVGWLLEHGANPKALDKNGATALHFLSLGDIKDEANEKVFTVPCALLLLDAGAHLTAENQNGETAIDAARNANMHHLEAFLSKRNLEKNLRPTKGEKEASAEGIGKKKVPKI